MYVKKVIRKEEQNENVKVSAVSVWKVACCKKVKKLEREKDMCSEVMAKEEKGQSQDDVSREESKRTS